MWCRNRILWSISKKKPDMPDLPKIVAVVGPTASGKTACGLEIARAFDGEVLAVDSRTVYRDMDIGTAKPSFDEKRDDVALPTSIHALFSGGKPKMVDGIPHWGFDLAEPSEDYSVAEFQGYAVRVIADILSRHRLPVLVGGTGLWMDAIVDNLSFPEVPPNKTLREEFERRTTDDLFAEYQRHDPQGAEEIDRDNKRRLVRALEVCRETGQPFSTLRKRGPEKYHALWVGMDVPKEVLEQCIGERVNQMIAKGLVSEVRRVRERYGADAPALFAIGYREICEFFDGYLSLEAAILEMKKNTRRFAKRQMTWFKRREEIVWVGECEEALAEVGAFVT